MSPPLFQILKPEEAIEPSRVRTTPRIELKKVDPFDSDTVQ